VSHQAAAGSTSWLLLGHWPGEPGTKVGVGPSGPS
jgi:hypothetical protein